MTLPNHDSNSYNEFIEANDLDEYTDFETMSLAELNLTLDNDILELTVPEILALPAELQAGAIEDFCEIDPELGKKLRLEILFANS